ncbi:Phosphate transport system permease protein PstA 1 [Austwickia sp. TVS 96-490-7B]|uniref:phosphate ABC transporter permease PstA n=1 Tax=Austwickia sp. TVS 96-490-7B TaxID=2830843 RepID=UPI001C590507|nr:phosphate ABC transporter permease PstA [Austwickia sp. TVS 96-490-7B]MBW3083872.1 Phosphate transport system permease protein PstA 1 [Austwickia sp. TVS 96-490-7B]
MTSTTKSNGSGQGEAWVGVGGSRRARNVLATVVVWSAFGIALVPLISIIGTVFTKGISVVATSQWWSQNQRGMLADVAGGGAWHAVQGTLLQGAVTALIALPIGVLTAVYLVEYGRGPLARVISFTVDILTGVPSIVAALFIYSLWVGLFGFGRVGFAVVLALVLLMIPTVTRSTEEMLKLVPQELREASYALGVPTWVTVIRVVLRTAASGIITGALLGLARVMGETAPLLILGPYTKNFNLDLFDGNMATLPTMIAFDRQNIALEATAARLWAAALTLILLILLLNVIGRAIGRWGAVKR